MEKSQAQQAYLFAVLQIVQSFGYQSKSNWWDMHDILVNDKRVCNAVFRHFAKELVGLWETEKYRVTSKYYNATYRKVEVLRLYCNYL